MENILEIKNLNISFKIEEHLAKAVHGLSFNLKKGGSVGIVGESGCGKSVTAMSIMRLLPSNAVIESGKIIYNGENILDYGEKKMQAIRGNKIALIPQDPLTSLNPLYTIGEQIIEVIELHQGVSGKVAGNIAVEALKAVKIPDAENRLKDYPHQFSGGMRQRVIIAIALSCHPDLIIADEPTTALDVTVQAQILNLIKSIQQEKGTSLILITHNLGVVAEVCDHVAVMYAGRLVEYADVKSIFSNPRHPYTKGLLNSLPDLKTERLEAIQGQPPGIFDDIKGCIFNPRCSFKFNKCEEYEPALISMNSSHKVSCHLYANSGESI